MEEKITVIVPVYRVESYLEKCVDSILNQSYTNLEIILVDDGSPDKCPEICDRYAEKDSRVKVIHQKNGGLSCARNAGIEIATGEYIGFVDSDDYIDSRMYESLYYGLKKSGADIAICGHYVERENRLSIETPPCDNVKELTSKAALDWLIEDVYIKSYAWDKLYRRVFFESIRYPAGRNYEDIAVTYRLFDRAKKIVMIPEYLYYYQMRSTSISCNNSDKKWMLNCTDIVESMNERYVYFCKKGEKELTELALAKMIPYIITLLNLEYRLKEYREKDKWKDFLQKNKNNICANKILSEKDKKLVSIYASEDWKCRMYVKTSGKNRCKGVVLKMVSKLRATFKSDKRLCFDLKPGKQIRVFLFELPCFDNLGDHAIAYAEQEFFKNLVQSDNRLQLFIVKGWDTPSAVKQLKREVKPSDMFICQGGGNMGNLYGFGEAFRRTIMKGFPTHTIIVFPQTMYFTEDKHGIKELKKSKKVYNRCKKLTLLARDGISYEKMKQEYSVTVRKMVDVVTYLDKSNLVSSNRDGVILCLRSDMESGLSAEEKKELQQLCQKHYNKMLVTDTVTKVDISEEDRVAVLEKKWRLFGNAELVITDRLHGMIFSLITGTPCIVLGNNHHKVRETYKTLEKCAYLWYAESVEQVKQCLSTAQKVQLPVRKTDFISEFEELKLYILSQLNM